MDGYEGAGALRARTHPHFLGTDPEGGEVLLQQYTFHLLFCNSKIPSFMGKKTNCYICIKRIRACSVSFRKVAKRSKTCFKGGGGKAGKAPSLLSLLLIVKGGLTFLEGACWGCLEGAYVTGSLTQ